MLLLLLLMAQIPWACSASNGTVVVETNPNLELFGVLYILAFNGSDPFIVAPPEYVKDVLTYFGPYKSHEAVKFVQTLVDKSLPQY
ncbi:hypothetical protein A3L04_00630 [Thermococcus chitonophagus]|uniref:Uncharacterized protein n=3 Tax=Thermococcus chitonophagus TaxID=54262 RepID=A0A2Z2N0V1_9EURY|nr:hypothetical protein A3L04_00630 [Thermococcus chitonophagus]